jgi:methionyl-tRNA formyltransferase
LKLVFMGTPPVAAACLKHLATTPHQIMAVCTHSDRVMGRGLKPHPTAVKEAALELGLPVREVPDVRDPAFEAWLRSLQADLLVLVAFVVLPDAILATTRLGAINLHGSLLPRWRGAAPVQRSLEAGGDAVGWSIFRLDSGIDTGGILLQRAMQVGPDETSGEVLARMGEEGGPALAEAIAMLSQEPVPTGTRQDPALATRAPKLAPEQGRLDWTLPARRLHDKIRAFHPAPGCWTELVESSGALARLKIWRTHAVPGPVVEPVETSGLVPGTLLPLPGNRVAVVCGEGLLELLEVQAEGKPRRSGSDWYNGVRGRDPSFR